MIMMRAKIDKYFRELALISVVCDFKLCLVGTSLYFFKQSRIAFMISMKIYHAVNTQAEILRKQICMIEKKSLNSSKLSCINLISPCISYTAYMYVGKTIFISMTQATYKMLVLNSGYLSL